MWRALVSIVIYFTKPSYKIIQSLQKPYIDSIGSQGNNENHDSLIHKDPHINVRVKFITGDNIILITVQRYSCRGV